MSSKDTKIPAKPAPLAQAVNQAGESGAGSAVDPAPGRDVLESMARGGDGGAAPEAGPLTDAQRWAQLYPEPVVEERHRQMAAKAVGAICGISEGIFPISYGEKRRLDGVAAFAPLCAKYEGEFPEWYHKYRLELMALAWVGSFGVVTVVEVKRVNAIEAKVEEIAAKYRGEGLTGGEARARALGDLGLVDGVQPSGAAKGGAETTH